MSPPTTRRQHWLLCNYKAQHSYLSHVSSPGGAPSPWRQSASLPSCPLTTDIIRITGSRRLAAILGRAAAILDPGVRRCLGTVLDPGVAGTTLSDSDIGISIGAIGIRIADDESDDFFLHFR